VKKFGLVVLGLVGVVGVLAWLNFVKTAYNYHQSEKTAQAVVILGTTAYVDGRLNQCLKARVDTAVKLYQTGRVKAVITTGGRDALDQPSQAQILASLVRYQGVPAQVIWTENDSVDTWENIKYAARIARRHNWNEVFLVTEPYHLNRALMIARHFGFQAYPAPALQSRCWQNRPTRYMLLLRDFLAYWQDYWRIINDSQ